jgi:SAM-dependent methyltransferase
MSIRSLAGKLCNPFTPVWFDRSIFDYMPKQGKVLNIGSGSTDYGDWVTNLDIVKLPNVDVIADAHALPFEDGYFDGVFCNAVLEHTIQPWVVAKEAQRVLNKGGIAYIQVPFLEGVHDEKDYFRFTLNGLKSLFPELEELKSGVSGSINQILADLVRIYPVLVLENTWLNLPVRFAMGWLAAPIRHLDRLIKRSPSMPGYARSVYFIGIRK